MIHRNVQMPPLTLRRLASCSALLALAMAPVVSRAQANPLTVTAGESLTYDNNFLRRPNGGPSETTSVTSLGLNLSKELGRQTYLADLSVSANRNHDLKSFDYDGYGLRLGLTSGVGARGYVSLQHNRSSSQQNPDEQTGARFVDRVKQRSTSLFAQYGVSGRIGFNANLVSGGSEYSRNFATNSDFASLRFGVSYSPSSLISFGLGAKKTEQHQPNVGEKINRYDYDLSTSWVVSGYSTLASSLAFSQEHRNLNAANDFKGFTGSLGWNFTPGGKLSYGLSLSRDTQRTGLPSQVYSYTGRTDTVSDIKAILTNQAQNQLTTSLGARVSWALSPKVNVGLGLTYSQFDDSREADKIGNISGLESQFLPSQGHQQNLQFTGNYTPIRWLRLGCALGAYKRTGSRESVPGYQGQTLGCDANVTLN
jgi:hypothetical protein